MQTDFAGRRWNWPARDTICWRAVSKGVGSLGLVYRRLSSFRTAIQAGGNMGVYPAALATRFARVITAEPDPECFAYLDQNVTEPNVTKMQVAFVAAPANLAMSYIDPENCGNQRTIPGEGIPGIPIDALGVKDCDLIYLDIEGAELAALKGAEETIRLTKPLICIEDNGLSEFYGVAKGATGKWLEQTFGYRRIDAFGRDVVFACR